MVGPSLLFTAAQLKFSSHPISGSFVVCVGPWAPVYVLMTSTLTHYFCKKLRVIFFAVFFRSGTMELWPALLDTAPIVSGGTALFRLTGYMQKYARNERQI